MSICIQAAGEELLCGPIGGGPISLGQDSEKVIRKEIFSAVTMVVTSAFGIDKKDLFAGSRRAVRIARARQVAFYLSHILGEKTYREVGLFFDRDRTTVAHGCRLIEDLRDDETFDRLLDRLEATVVEWCQWKGRITRYER